MPRIWHENKTVEWRTMAEDEAKARVGLQELLDKNPGYKPVLIVEDDAGKETTYTNLTSADVVKRRRGRPRTRPAVAEEPILGDEVAEDGAVEDSTEE